MNIFLKYYSFFLDFHRACKAKSLLHVSMHDQVHNADYTFISMYEGGTGKYPPYL